MHRDPSAGTASGDDTGPDAGSPSAEALVAGTVALMTTWADPRPDCRPDAATHRSLLARKIVSNLFFLQEHPALSCGLRQVMAMAHQRWMGVARSCDVARAGAGAAPSQALH